MALNITGRNLYFKSGIDNKQLKKDSKEAQREISGMTGKVKKSGQSMAKALKTAFKFIIGAVVVKKIIDIGKALFKAGSQAEEIRSKFEVTFQGINEEADKTAEALSKGFGIARVKAEELLSTTGDLLTGFGFSREAALGTSLAVQQLAVDLASFNNLAGGAAQASTIITKALLGEKDSLVTLGVKILDSDIQHELLRMGMEKLTGTALLQAKALVTLDMITRQSKNAIGDFARTSQSAANQQRILKENIKDLTINLSKRLVPAVGKTLIDMNKLVRSFVDLTKVNMSGVFRDEQVALNTLVLQITSANTKQEDRLRLIKQLREEYPFFLEDLKTEELTNENIAKRLAEVNENYVNKIIIQKENEKIAKAAAREARRYIKQAESELKIINKLSEVGTKLGITHQLVGKSYKEQFDIIQKHIRTIDAEVRVKEKLYDVIPKLTELYDLWQVAVRKSGEANEDMNAVLEAKLAILKLLNIEEEELFNRTKIVTKVEEKPVVREVDPNLERIETTEHLKKVTEDWLELSKKGVELHAKSLLKIKPHIKDVIRLYGDMKDATIAEKKEAIKMIDKMIKAYKDYDKTVTDLLEERREIMEELLKSVYAVEEALGALERFLVGFDVNIGRLIKSASDLYTAITLEDAGGMFGGVLSAFKAIYDIGNQIREERDRAESEERRKSNEKLNVVLNAINRNLQLQLMLLAEINGTQWLVNAVEQVKDIEKEMDGLLDQMGEIEVRSSRRGHPLIDTSEWDIDKWQEMLDKYYRLGYEGAGFGFGGYEENVQDYIDSFRELEEARRRLADAYAQELTGTTTESIANAIAQGFDEGIGSAEIFANTFENLIRNSMIEALKRSLYDEGLKKFYKKFWEFAEEEGLSKEEIEQLGLDYRTMIEDAEGYWEDMMKVWKEVFGEDFALPGEEDPLTRAIKGVTEETAGVLAGQLMGIRIDVAQGLEVAENSFLQLVEIAENTSYNRYLEQIAALLNKNSEQTLVRSGGG